MRAGLVASTIGHLAVLLWGVIAFPDARPFNVPPVDSLPVDLVPISELTKLRKGEKTAELREQEAPKPTEKKAEAPQPDAKTGDAKKEQPTPSVPEAKAQPAKAQPAPAPTPPAPKAPEPPAPREVAEPQPAPAPAPAPVAEKAPKAEPQKVEEAPKVAEATPVKVTPRSKPTPPKRTQTARTEEKKKEFDSSQIAALLNKVDPSGGGTHASSQPASLGSDKGQSNVQMTQSELDALRGQIARCWNPPVGAAGADDLNVRLKVYLTQGGDVDLLPEVLNSSGNPSFGIAAESAKRAVLRCAPYSLPVAKYDSWREVIINFDPRELLGG